MTTEYNINLKSPPPKKTGFECETCKKTFTRKYSLKCHSNNIHPTINPPSSLNSHTKSPPALLGKELSKKSKKSKSKQKDRLRRYSRTVEDLKRKIKKERELIKQSIEKKRENSGFLSPEYKQIQKITMEWNEIDGIKEVTVERLGIKPEFSWPKEWDYKIEQGDKIKKFRAPTPDTFKAYNYYLNPMKINLHNQQLTFDSSQKFVPSQKFMFYR